MDEELLKKIRALLDGLDGARETLVEALRQADAESLVEALRHESPLVRAAGAAVIGGRSEQALRDAAAVLSEDRDDIVRLTLAETLAAHPTWPVDPAVYRRLLEDEDDEVRRVAASAAAEDCVDLLCNLLAFDSAWEVRVAVAKSLARCRPDDVLTQALHSLGEDSDRDVQRACAAVVEGAMVQAGGYPDHVARPAVATMASARERLDGLGGRSRYPVLHEWLVERATHDIDHARLAGFGTILGADVPRAHGIDAVCETVLDAVLSGGTRSAVLLGEQGSGKTAIVHELAHRLMADGWVILRTTATELMSGTKYIGEWETRLRGLVDAARAPRKVLVYIPNIEELTTAGSTSSSDRNMAQALAQALESGTLALVGETTPQAYERAIARAPSLRSLLRTVEVKPADDTRTREILESVCHEHGADPGLLDRLCELANFYNVGTVQPGRAVGLLRSVLARATQPTPRDVLETLSRSTGIPADFLDDDVPLNLARVRTFFESRVMGQPEAVAAVLDLVALVKSGLTDPGKPYGVLFFVGPTGVGKTELARALAEFLFGEAARLKRFDMSEYSTYYAFERLIGTGQREGLLTSAVREHPFSVLLLDEIEKAHQNVFDLCLQIFDAGRLTDSRGRTADFRRSIVILTSNVGSAVPDEPSVGFGEKAQPAPDRDQILRDLGRFFRPEFLNRLDRVVSFRPLAVETAEKIARRELANVIERSGIARRRLAVDIDPQVLALLLKEGYSPAFGARPLKRTVERRVLMPLAHAIAAGRVRDGSVLRLRASHNAVLVDVIEADEEEGGAGAAPPAGLDEVKARVTGLRERAAAVEERKADLLEETHSPSFWYDPARARGVLDQVHRLDSLLGELGRLEANLRVTERNPDRRRAAEFLAMHDRQATRLDFLFSCDDLGDAVVTITLVKRQGEALDGVASLAGMYRSLARRRGLECELLDDRNGGDPREHTMTLAMGGAGAYALLRNESGLHQLSRTEVDERRDVQRSLVRVEVLRAPVDESPLDDVRVETRPLEGGRVEFNLLHVPTLTSLRAWSDGRPDEALGKLHPLLRARVEQGTPDTDNRIVRRYRFGPSPLVRDRRTGRSTGRLDRVLSGEVDFCA